ncbi:MAG: hypothetical protein AAF842_01385 [Planctomycetota bacterium]
MLQPTRSIHPLRRRIDLAAAGVVAVALLTVTAMTFAQPRRDNPNGSWKARANWSTNTNNAGSTFNNAKLKGDGTFKSLNLMKYSGPNSGDGSGNTRLKGKVRFRDKVNPNNTGDQMVKIKKARAQINYADGQRDIYKFGEDRVSFQVNSNNKWVFRGRTQGDLQKRKLPNGNTTKPFGEMDLDYKFVSN